MFNMTFYDGHKAIDTGLKSIDVHRESSDPVSTLYTHVTGTKHENACSYNLTQIHKCRSITKCILAFMTVKTRAQYMYIIVSVINHRNVA